MRTLFAAVIIALLSNPAFAERFNFSGGQVVTHRGTVLTLNQNVVIDIDQKNKMTCLSDAGCSIVIQTEFVVDVLKAQSGPYVQICTYIDKVAADPGCPFVSGGILSSFQGKPNVSKGEHVVQTTAYLQKVNNPDPVPISSWQVVYTLYQRE
jgi:hypothetical protein